MRMQIFAENVEKQRDYEITIKYFTPLSNIICLRVELGEDLVCAKHLSTQIEDNRSS